MRTLSRWIKRCTVIGVAALLAACSGNSSGGAFPQQGASSVAHAQATQSIATATLASESIDDATPDATCTITGKDISVRPCAVAFSPKNLKPADIRVRSRVKKAVVTETDDCASRGIAAVTGGPSDYVVTPGVNAGTCSVTFASKDLNRKLGTATVAVDKAT